VGIGLIIVATVLGLWTGISMWRHPDQPPLGWRLGSVPPPERMRALGIAVTFASAIFGAFMLGLWVTWLAALISR
jgi:hypothetical protein